LTEAWGHDPVKDITDKIRNPPNKESIPKQTSIYNFRNKVQSSSDNSLSVSDNINFSTDTNNDFSLTSAFRETDSHPSILKCSKNDNNPEHIDVHLKNCNYCYAKMKKIIDRKVQQKLRESTSLNVNPGITDSWKDTLIIVAGAVIVIFILFLISRNFDK